MITGKNCIGGQFKADGSQEFRTINPKKNAENPTVFIEATKDEIESAAELAWEAFKTFRKIPWKTKSRFFEHHCR